MSTENEYMPQAGDVVVFPNAPSKFNQTTRYKITDVSNGEMEFETEYGVGPWTGVIDELRKLGMRKADEPAKETAQ